MAASGLSRGARVRDQNARKAAPTPADGERDREKAIRRLAREARDTKRSARGFRELLPLVRSSQLERETTAPVGRGTAGEKKRPTKRVARVLRTRQYIYTHTYTMVVLQGQDKTRLAMRF